MDAVKFIKERNRMCKTNVSCFGCPAHTLGASNSCKFAMENWTSPEQQINLVKEWAADHPRKTRQSVFLELHPNARVTADGTVGIWPCDVAKNMQNVIYCNSLSCIDCRREFWTEEVE